ncbi:mitochondrial import receptor subunit TOM70-like [Symsagittifera roscoffensis]|uniref:mitochondrial import receptor subunit TOM70-like n=1 Tax=Symsagittifera roscoffensis TaxID=84072 RepID=UPI00307C1F2F
MRQVNALPIASQSADGSSWTWKHVALGAAGVVLVGVSSYGIYSYFIKPDGTVSKGKKGRGGKSSTPKNLTEVNSDISTTKTALESAVEAKMRGNKYFKGKMYSKAVECYQEALALSGAESSLKGGDTTQGGDLGGGEKLASAERATFYHNLAAAYEKMEKPEDVVRECSNCLKISPKYIKALSKRAKAYKSLGELEYAIQDITAAALLEDLANAENMQLSEVITKELSEKKAKEKYASKTSRPSPSKHFVNGYFDSFTFNIFDCETPSEDADTSKGFLKAKKLFEEGDDFEGVESACSYEIDRVGEESPFYINALLVRGTFRLLSGAAKLALEDLEKVVNSPKSSALQKSNALIKRGSLHMQNQENFRAMADFEQSVEVADESVDAHHHRGQLFLLMEDNERCIDEFNKCIKLDPSFDQPAIQLCYANYKVAATQRDLIKANRALEEFKDILKKFPKSSDGHAMYAQALADAGQPTESLAMFDKAIALCPENAANYVHKGMLLLQLKGDYNAAIDLIKQSIEKDPRSDFAYEMMGNIEIKRGDYSAAAKAFEKSVDNARFEVEMERMYFLYLSASSWKYVKDNYGIDVSTIIGKAMQ